uniref:acylglycerol lipase n=1 Tax=Xenopus tropicalis TaxID=8364 RepID=A0A803JSW5_XENTR
MGRGCHSVSLRQYSMGVQLIVCPEHSFSVYLYLYIWVGGAIVFPLDSTVWGYSLLCAQNIPSLYIFSIFPDFNILLDIAISHPTSFSVAVTPTLMVVRCLTAFLCCPLPAAPIQFVKNIYFVFLLQFVESIGLNKKPFHLVGTSMGGNVAGVYAAQYPTDISSLTLICPAGLDYPNDSTFLKHLKGLEKSSPDDQRIPLIPSTATEMQEMLRLCSFVRFKIPQQVLQGLVDVRIPHNEFYRRLFLALVDEKSRHSLHENMGKIVAPTQIIWGKQDQVLDVSGTEVLAGSIRGCQVEILENCGHSVVMERPRKSAKLMTDFLSSLQSTENNKKHD